MGWFPVWACKAWLASNSPLNRYLMGWSMLPRPWVFLLDEIWSNLGGQSLLSVLLLWWHLLFQSLGKGLCWGPFKDLLMGLLVRAGAGKSCKGERGVWRATCLWISLSWTDNVALPISIDGTSQGMTTIEDAWMHLRFPLSPVGPEHSFNSKLCCFSIFSFFDRFLQFSTTCLKITLSYFQLSLHLSFTCLCSINLQTDNNFTCYQVKVSAPGNLEEISNGTLYTFLQTVESALQHIAG